VRLARVELANVRCIDALVMEPGEGINLLWGQNGAGKTAILEGIHVIGTGRSFRSGGLRELIRWGSQALSARCRLLRQAGAQVVEVERGPALARIAIDRKGVRSAAVLARALPLVLFDVGSSELIEGGPKARRRWLDTTLFHVEPRYLEQWLGYHRALRQRNAALMAGTVGSAGTPFDRQLTEQAQSLHEARDRIFVELSRHVRECSERLLAQPLELTLRQGWPEGMDFGTSLMERLASDRELGMTQYGPHRADVAIRYGDRGARHHASRGQGKLAACVLQLAQAAVVAASLGETPVLLVDDVAAELDAQAREKVMQVLVQSAAQVFLTTTDPALFDPGRISATFHVERGRIAA
jgi:DNA replication and repair protein RecF